MGELLQENSTSLARPRSGYISKTKIKNKKHKGARTKTRMSVFCRPRGGVENEKTKTTVHNLFPTTLKVKSSDNVIFPPLMASSVLRKVYVEKRSRVSCWGDVNVSFGHKTPFCVQSFAVCVFLCRFLFFSLGFVLNG